MAQPNNPLGWDPTAKPSGFLDFADREIARRYETLYGTASVRANNAADPVTGGLTEVQYGDNKRANSGEQRWVGEGNYIEPRDRAHAELMGHNDPENWELLPYEAPPGTRTDIVQDDASLDPLAFYGTEQAYGNINWHQVPEEQLPATVLNASQYYEDKNQLAGLLAFRDAFGYAEGAYDSSLAASDRSREISLRNAQGDWNRQSRATNAAMGRRGLGGSTVAQSYGMSGDLANMSMQADISAGFDAERAQIEVAQANALVGLLTGQNIGGGGMDPNSAFSMMGQYGSSGAGQENPDLGASGTGAAIGGGLGFLASGGNPYLAIGGAYVGNKIEEWIT